MDIARSIADERVVMMCGVSGSGKTFFSRMLERQGFARLSADRLVWERYGHEFTTMPFPVQKKIFQDVAGRIIDMMCGLLSDGHKVVIDATMCKRVKRDAVVRACEPYGVRPLIVYLDAPFGVLRERLARRKGIGADDQVVDEERLRAFHANFVPPSPDENFIAV